MSYSQLFSRCLEMLSGMVFPALYITSNTACTPVCSNLPNGNVTLCKRKLQIRITNSKIFSHVFFSWVLFFRFIVSVNSQLNSQKELYTRSWAIEEEPHHIFFLFTLAVTDVWKLQENMSVRSLDGKTTKLKTKSVIFVISKNSANI